MIRLFKILLVMTITMLMSCNRISTVDKNSLKCNSIYHWKTTFNIDTLELNFLERHSVSRIYLRMFDVAIEQNYETENPDIVPIATTKFVTPIPDGIEIVPVVYITIDALRAMSFNETDYASLIVERILAMSSYNKCGNIREIQLDCDWTSSTKNSYHYLCKLVKEAIASKNIKLSVTVRLHQLQETAPPADKGVLMLYNTGALKNYDTKNSILDINDVKYYLKRLQYPIPLDYAFPVFGWGVKFKKEKFVSIVSENDSVLGEEEHIRRERPPYEEIMTVKNLVEEKLGKPVCGNILYHLDNSQLKNYNDNEISQIFTY